MCTSTAPKFAPYNVVGCIEGKNAISITRNFMGPRRKLCGEDFCAQRQFVSTAGHDEDGEKRFREQEKEDEHLEQVKLGSEDGSHSEGP